MHTLLGEPQHVADDVAEVIALRAERRPFSLGMTNDPMVWYMKNVGSGQTTSIVVLYEDKSSANLALLARLLAARFDGQCTVQHADPSLGNPCYLCMAV
jgi:hypothetical protein